MLHPNVTFIFVGIFANGFFCAAQTFTDMASIATTVARIINNTSFFFFMDFSSLICEFYYVN